MKKKKDNLPLTLHGVVSLFLPIPCFLIMFVLNAFLALLVPGSAEASGGSSFISVLPMLIPPVFCLIGIYRVIRCLLRNKRSWHAWISLAMCALGLVEFIALAAFSLRY